MKLNRRKILISFGSAAIVSLVGYRKLKSILTPRVIPGKILGGNFSRGHLIRDPKFPDPSQEIYTQTLIIGAGISGLSAGYHLKREQKENFLILDLESRIGGKSSSSKNKTGPYPLAAHYLPIPSSESNELKNFLKECDVIKNIENGVCEYNELFLCFDPKERLFLDGRWQYGLEPSLGLSQSDQAELKRFFSLMNHYKKAIGHDGKRAFALPVNRSSVDIKYRELDLITMSDFMKRNDFKNSYLIWYVNYCCRDDYGAPMNVVSAWAGIHYFACRNGEGLGVEESSLLTWPEGNSFLAHKLAKDISDKIKLNSLVYKIKQEKDSKYSVWSYDFNQNKTILYKTDNIIYSSPFFTAKKIIDIPDMNMLIQERQDDYAPWMTANIEFDGELSTRETFLCWDNVNFHGKSLGYIYADHQKLSQEKQTKNITFYFPLMESSTKLARVKALTRTHQQWCEDVITECELMHPNIREHIISIDISLWGHGMSIPKPGFLKKVSPSKKHFVFAHTDQVGISLFEEGFYQGLEASKIIAKAMS